MYPKSLSFDWKTKDIETATENIKTFVRFLKYCKKDDNGLLYWSGGCFRGGYGQFRYGKRKVKAHRMAYAMFVGNVPEGICVCHRNDDPACVDPSQLFLGTKADNNADRDRKGHGCHGENHYRAKLTDAQIRDIRARYSPGRSNHPNQSDLAKEYGVSTPLMSGIVRGETWKHV